MPSEETPKRTKPDSDSSKPGRGREHLPYEDIVAQVVSKIRNEPFLFVIGIAALLIGFFIVATKLGSPDVRLLVLVIASLAFVAIAGYYILEAAKLDANYLGHAPDAEEAQGQSLEKPDDDSRKGTDIVQRQQSDERVKPVNKEEIDSDQVDLVKLRNVLVQRFSTSDLKDLCFDLGLDYETLSGDNKRDMARNLIRYYEMRGRISDLVDIVNRLRPNAL